MPENKQEKQNPKAQVMRALMTAAPTGLTAEQIELLVPDGKTILKALIKSGMADHSNRLSLYVAQPYGRAWLALQHETER